MLLQSLNVAVTTQFYHMRLRGQGLGTRQLGTSSHPPLLSQWHWQLPQPNPGVGLGEADL